MMLLRRAPSAQRAVSSPAAVSSSYMALSAYFRRQAALEPQISLNALKLSRRNLHWTPSPDSPKRPASTTSKPTNHQESPSKHPTGTSPRQDLAQQSTEEVLAHLSNFPSSLRRLALSLPSSSLRRPTKDELLSSTSSFLERLKIRFKWFTIRGFRRFRADDWSAFASWIVGGVGIWIIVGTTSFFSAVFLLLNSLQMQEYIATSLGSYLTSQAGITIAFESAIVPRFSWGDSKLTFRNVYVSRGLGPEDANARDAVTDEAKQPNTGKLPRIRRATGEVLTALKNRNQDKVMKPRSPEEHVASSIDAVVPAQPDDPATRYTKFHLSIDTIEVTLSLPRWLDGKGLVREAVVKGVRGVIDRSHIVHVVTDGTPYDRSRYRHTAKPGDFHLESLQVEDFLVTVYQPDNFRPYTFSIFSAAIATLRKQWLFFDMLSADSIVGQVDNCLFSLHKPQSIGRTSEDDLRDGSWKRMSRFRVDGVAIDHMQSSSDNGPLSWITSGKADLVADIRFPREPGDDIGINTIIGDIVDNLDTALRSPPSTRPDDRIPGRPRLAGGKALEAPTASLRHILGIDDATSQGNEPQRAISIDLDIRFKDLKAVVPLLTDSLSPVSNALVRPIVAFVNSNKTLIPVKCHLDIPFSEFDGSWTTYDIGLLEDVSAQVYEALAHHVRESNAKRAKVVGIWSLQKSAANILGALRQNLEHA